MCANLPTDSQECPFPTLGIANLVPTGYQYVVVVSWDQKSLREKDNAKVAHFFPVPPTTLPSKRAHNICPLAVNSKKAHNGSKSSPFESEKA